MRIALSFLILLSLPAWAKCEFNSTVKKVFSLSGPVTVGLKHLGLLKDSKLRSISIFNPISPVEFKGEVLPGGLFLSPSVLSNFRDGVVFFDEGQELTRTFSAVPGLKPVPLGTRGLNPEEVQALVLKKLGPFISGCEKEIKTFNQRLKDLQQELLSNVETSQRMIFYLGELRYQRSPDTVIANDGVVKWLKDLKKLVTYPSDLAYVGWSSKVMNSIASSSVHVGIKDSGRTFKKELLREAPNRYNLIFPGALVPGISQVEAWVYLFKGLRAKL